MSQAIELSLEQKFSLRVYSTQVEKMSQEETQSSLIALYEHIMLQENRYKYFLAQQWGMEPSV
jgi:hypothetical protein